MSYLYRGVNKEQDLNCNGELRPKGHENKAAIKINDHKIKIDGKIIIGDVEENAVRLHQLEIESYRWCMISTTRDIKVAEHFATSGNCIDGYVYTIDENQLEIYGVISHERFYNENSHELEITLRAKDCGNLPMEIVISKREVKPN